MKFWLKSLLGIGGISISTCVLAGPMVAPCGGSNNPTYYTYVVKNSSSSSPITFTFNSSLYIDNQTINGDGSDIQQGGKGYTLPAGGSGLIQLCINHDHLCSSSNPYLKLNYQVGAQSPIGTVTFSQHPQAEGGCPIHCFASAARGSYNASLGPQCNTSQALPLQ